MDYTHFPSADPAKCDKGYETPNGCLAHGMKRYYGGILAEPQGVRIKPIFYTLRRKVVATH